MILTHDFRIFKCNDYGITYKNCKPETCHNHGVGLFNFNTMEAWKEIPGYDGKYEVSNKGRIRSYSKIGCKSGRVDKPRIIGKYDVDWYPTVNLYRNKKGKTVKIHRLVAEAFIPNPENKPCTNHKDGDKTNNNVDNLEWVTYQENAQHGFDNGIIDSARGESQGASKLTEKQVLEIRGKYKSGGVTQKRLGEIYGVSGRNIGDIVARNTWKHI